MACMLKRGSLCSGCKERPLARPPARMVLRVTVVLAGCFQMTGCLSSLNQHATALSVATAPVVEGAASAYRSAQALHDTRVDYDAVAEFDQAAPVYNPRKIEPLLSEQGIDVRLAVLAAFQAYTQEVVDISSGTNSKELREASASAGAHLAALGNLLAPSIETTFGVAQASASSTTTVVTTTAGDTTTSTTSTTSDPAPAAITPQVEHGISTAVDALAQFLVRKKVKQQLPKSILEMDQHLQLLAKLLQDDLATMQDQEDRDYNFILNRQTLFIRASAQLNPQQRREEIMKLPEIVREQRISREQLAGLKAAVIHLANVHHALADKAKSADKESLREKLQELAAAGGDLAHFYSLLPAPTTP